MYKYSIADRNHPIQEGDIKEENDMRENDYKDRERRILCSVIERMFPDGGETYTLEEVKRLFEEEGVNQNFEDTLSKCIEAGWIVDCGNGNYTR